MLAVAAVSHPPSVRPPKLATFDLLMAHAAGSDNQGAIAGIYASWRHREGALPDWLGLTPQAFYALFERLFPGLFIPPAMHGLAIDPARLPEVDELARLMLGHRAQRYPEEPWIAWIVAVACLGSDHLWQDLGLFSRKELSALIARNFPTLAAKNDRDMKWKKFFYKQLCETEGIYTCRSPSCEVCADYQVCFGAEE